MVMNDMRTNIVKKNLYFKDACKALWFSDFTVTTVLHLALDKNSSVTLNLLKVIFLLHGTLNICSQIPLEFVFALLKH